MTHAERIAKVKRELAELKSRLGRIEAETFAGKRSIDEIAAELQQLEGESEAQP